MRGPVARTAERTVVAPRVEACEAEAAWSETHGRCVSRDEHGVWTRMAVGPTRVKFRWIPPGRFVMGSAEGEEGGEGDETPHEVELTRGFWLGETEVTQAQWRAVVGSNPSFFPGEDRPVERVTWDDVQGFLRRANEGVTGMSFRLPTEAEWEFAARAGSTAPSRERLEEARFCEVHGPPGCSERHESTHPVGQQASNAWGLRDVLGNVREWTTGWYGPYPAGRAVDPTGPVTGVMRVVRGGSWRQDAWHTRVASRDQTFSYHRDDTLGFRLARGS